MWLSSRKGNDDDNESSESATKSVQSANARAVPRAEQEQPDTFDDHDFRKGNQAEDNYFPEGASPRQSRVERGNDMPNNYKEGQGTNESDRSVDSHEEPQFFL